MARSGTALNGVGIAGIVGYLVTRRNREIGLRVALGAHPGDILWLLLHDGLRPVLFGLIAGSAGAFAVARAIRALLFGLQPLDALSFTAALALLALAAGAAALIPASRAARADPASALRT